MIQSVWGVTLSSPRWTVEVLLQSAVLGVICLSMHVMVKHAFLLGFVLFGDRVADQDMSTIAFTSLCQGIAGALFLSASCPAASIARRLTITILLMALVSALITATRLLLAL